MVWTNHKTEHKDAHTMMFTKNILSSPDAYETQTRGRSSTNRVNHKNKLSNNIMEHGGACRATQSKEFTKFANMCFANSISIKWRGGLIFRAFLISRSTKGWPGGHNKVKNHLILFKR